MYKRFDWNTLAGASADQAHKAGMWNDKSFSSSIYTLAPNTDFGPYRFMDSDAQYVVLSGQGTLYYFEGEAFQPGEFYQPDPVIKVDPTPKPSVIYERAKEALALKPTDVLAVRAGAFHGLRSDDELIVLVTHSSTLLRSQFVAR